MIRLITPQTLPLLQRACLRFPLYGSMILSTFHVWGEDWRQCSAWVGETPRGEPQGEPQLALCRLGGEYRLAGRQLEAAALEELAAFLRLSVPGTIHGPSSLTLPLNRLLGRDTYSSVAMVQPAPQPPVPPLPGTPPFRILPCDNLGRLFQVICQGYPYFREHAHRESWMSSLFARRRVGGALAAELWVEDRPVGSGILKLSPLAPMAEVGTISTVPEYQGRGLGSQMVAYLSQKAWELGKQPSLDCAEPSLVPFYRRLGYQPSFPWTILE